MNIFYEYPGGKARLVDWLTSHFPHEGDIYLEPFAGRGNVFFNIAQMLMFDTFIINDKNTGRFFKSILECDPNLLPAKVDRSDFEYWKFKALANDPMALVLEPKISFRGKGYDSGYQGDCHSRYNYGRYSELIKNAKSVLISTKCIILDKDYQYINYSRLTEDSFVYIDPPYYETDGVGYDNIDHEHLLQLLVDAKFRWALSGYQSDLYLAYLGEPYDSLTRNLEMSNASNQSIECIWRNY